MLKVHIFDDWVNIDACSHNKAELFVVFNFEINSLFGIFPHKSTTVLGSYVGCLQNYMIRKNNPLESSLCNPF